MADPVVLTRTFTREGLEEPFVESIEWELAPEGHPNATDVFGDGQLYLPPKVAVHVVQLDPNADKPFQGFYDLPPLAGWEQTKG